MSGERRVVAAIDQGTTSTRCLLFDHDGRMVGQAQREHSQRYPQPGWVQHDAEEIWRNVTRVVPMALRDAGLTVANVAALGLANQRETTVIWDRRTGEVLGPAITWQDTRADRIVEQLVAADHAETFRTISGLRPAGYFAGPRLRWLLDHIPGLEQRARSGDAVTGTMESWLLWRLTGGVDGGQHLSDVTNASRTMLMDLRTRAWDSRLLDLLDIPGRMLPRIVPTTSPDLGVCTEVLPGVRIGSMIGDQQAALFGQTCFRAGEAKCTYGTGAFLLMNTGTSVTDSTHGLLPTVAFDLGEGPRYALEGSIAVTGSLVQWVRDSLGMIPTAPQIETLARSVADNGGCYVVPAFSGLFSPHWRPDARGSVVGLTAYVTRGHLARAVLEATGWQTRDVVAAMEADAGIELRALKVDGGMTANHLLMQFVADVLDVPVERPLVAETVSLGAAYTAGLGVGYWSDLEGLRRNWHQAGAWYPELDPQVREREAANWSDAVARTVGWVPRRPDA